MAQIYNSDLTKALVDGAKIQVSKEYPPQQLAEKVVPVMECNPALLRVINVAKYAASATTIYTTPVDTDFYLTSAAVAITTAGANSGIGTITAVLRGEITAVQVVAVCADSAAAATVNACNSQSLTFVPPILLARGSAISSTSASTQTKVYSITGYNVYNVTA